MASVYSTQFIKVHASGLAYYFVPVGFVAVVRDIDCFYSGGVGSYVNVENDTSGNFAYFDFPASIDGALQMWRGRQIFPPGDAFGFVATDPVDMMISGYLLTLP